MIVDTHTHFYDPQRPEGIPWPPIENKLLYRPVFPDHFKAVSAGRGISGTIVVEASEWLEDNQWILDLAQEEPCILGFVGNLDPVDEKFTSHLARFASNPLFRGIRCRDSCFHQVPSAKFLSAMQVLAAEDYSLDVLVYRNQLENLLQIADAVPGLRIVVDHVGHTPIDGQSLGAEWHNYYEELASRPGIFMKVSALPELSVVQPAPESAAYYQPLLDVLWAAFGSERLMYGSNWPVCERAGDYDLGLKIVQNFFSDKGDQAVENFFWRNAKRVYKWLDR